MSPSLTKTRSDPGSSGNVPSPSTGSTTVVSDRLPLPSLLPPPFASPAPFVLPSFFISPRFPSPALPGSGSRGRACRSGGASQPADRTSAQLPQLFGNVPRSEPNVNVAPAQL